MKPYDVFLFPSSPDGALRSPGKRNQTPHEAAFSGLKPLERFSS
jgi:hypothetical protein